LDETEQGAATGPATPPALAWLAPRPWLAFPFVTLIATTFAAGTAIIRFAFAAGAGTLTVVTTRVAVGAAGIGLVLALLRVPVRLEGRERWGAPLLGTMMVGYSYAMYRGLERMPVALTIITFYTYPLLTGLFAWAAGQVRLRPMDGIALLLAFAGLVLALDVRGDGFDLVGVLWASLAALGFAVFLVLVPRLFAGGDARARTFVMLVAASVAGIVASLAAGDVAFPRTGFGFAVLLVSSLLYMLAINTMMLATAALGPARVAMVMNVEPLASLVLAYLILGERLGPLQILGAIAVVLAIFLFRPDARTRRG
jgi:drug/metabolite transporter (DMT)-like permease